MKFDIYYPVKPKVETQSFGDTSNLQYYKDNGITFSGHNGIDYRASHGQPVYATHDGNAFYEVDSKGGCGVIIRTNKAYDYGIGTAYFKTIYWHLCDGVQEPQFKSPITFTDISGVGQPIKAGDLIGYADNTGLSAGTHLHFGLKPQVQGEANGLWLNVESTNGYMGAIDPSKYFNGYFAEDAQKVVSILSTIISIYKKLISKFNGNK